MNEFPLYRINKISDVFPCLCLSKVQYNELFMVWKFKNMNLSKLFLGIMCFVV